MRSKIGNLSKNSELLILTIVSKESTDHSIPYHVSDGANLIECLQHQMSLANPPKSNRARPITIHAMFLFSCSDLPEFNYNAGSYDRLVIRCTTLKKF